MKTKPAGALLFAIITAFVLSIVGATLVILTTNQYRVVNSEIERTRAFYRAQAGMEYAIYKLYNNTSGWIPNNNTITQNVTIDNQTINISITHPDPDGRSSYKMSINASYGS